jgi:hypothetical protein
MSDEKSDAVSRRELGLALLAFQSSASRADAYSRQRRTSWIVLAFVGSLPALVYYGWAAWSLWLATHGGQWQDFWAFTLATVAWAAVVFILLLIVPVRGLSPARLQRLDKGIQALRQAAAAGDNRLAPKHESVEWSDADELASSGASSGTTTIGPLERLGGGREEFLVLLGPILLLIALPALGSALYRYFAFSNLHDPIIIQDFTAATLMLVAGILAIVVAAFWPSTFTVTADEQGVRWQRPAFTGLGRHAVQAIWPDVQTFITFMMRQGDSGESEVFLLDTTNEALAWRITPKTPSSVREAHERFVRAANEHAPLRDITASLKDLLQSPETRAYEYAVLALSGPAPIPAAVRKVLTTPVHGPRFLRGYLLVAAILLAPLVAAGLLLQFGLLPVGAF